ncbi:MAG: CocE/NonD family hydrolase [Proteobacteria bacterium]|nr:CocE/NonD family hydrolase [Pseudomonadota bacterium]
MSLDWRLPDPGPFSVRDHVQVPMADGVRLSARLWLPDDGPTPMVVEMIPYRKHDLYRGHDDAWGAALAARGIAYARLDVRGSGESEGVLTDEYTEAELDDGVAAIAWLAAQPFCTGAVGMRGLSWGGINTLQVASRRPPALKAILALGTCENRFTDDAHYIGGALGRANLQWGVLFKTVMAAPPNPAVFGEGWAEAWRERLEATPPILATWLSHQRLDAYWRRGSVAFDPEAIACPTYVVGGWADTYVNAAPRLLETLTVPRKGLVGPWGHTYPWASNVGLDWAFEEIRWWSHWLKGEATGIMDEPMLRAFMPYATTAQAAPEPASGSWVAEPTWPPTPETRPVHTVHLAPGAFSDAPGEGHATVAGDVVVGLAKPEWLDRLPAEQSADDAHAVLFDGPPLDGDLEILGTPVVRLRLATDRPLAHVAVRLCAVEPDGRSWLVAYALRNLTHRASHTDPEPLTPGEAVDVELPMAFVAHRFAAGQRLRLAISESLWPLVWPSPKVATLTLDLAGCHLDLPVKPADTPDAPMPIAALPQGPGAERPDPIAPAADGRYVLAETETPHTVRPRGAGVAVTRSRESLAELVPGDPSSSHWRQVARTAFAGDAFDCALEAGGDLTATPTMFRLTEWVRAWRDGALVFERETSADIPRDLL